MTPDRYQLIKQIFLEVLEVPEGQRLSAIKQRCPDDPELQHEVRELLLHHEGFPGPSSSRGPSPNPTRPTLLNPAAADTPGSPQPNSPQSDSPQSDSSPPASPDSPDSPDDGTARGQGAQPPTSKPGTGHTAYIGSQPRTFRASDHNDADVRLPSSRSRVRIDHGRFPPGSLVAGRYRIVELIGRGGMGEVYRADDLKLGEPVALKFLPKQLAGNREWLQRFLEEVRVARNVSHPNVCRVYDVAEHKGGSALPSSSASTPAISDHFISMEYVNGETLSAISQRIGRLTPAKAQQLAQQLCAGLAAIHDLGILHRDLKPSNILVDDRGQLKVTDFGLAVPGEIKGFQAAAGTPGYVAPESLAGVEATVRSDIYQLGLLLYELFTGVPAYRSTDGTDLLKLQQKTDPPAPSTVAPDIMPEVEQTILRCLDRDPNARPASARQVARMLPGGDPLTAALEAGQTPSPTLVAMAGRRGRLKPLLAAALLITFFAATIAGIWLGQRASLFQQATLSRSPEVLADRARDILESLGYSVRSGRAASSTASAALSIPRQLGDEAYALDLYEELLDEIQRTDSSPGRWDRLRLERPSPIDFWYRWSPQAIGTLNPLGVVTMYDPPFATPGMIAVRLSPLGKLRELSVLDQRTYWNIEDRPVEPLADGVKGPPPPLVDWSPIFTASGLDQTLFRAVAPERIPQVFAQDRAAWTGVYPENPAQHIRVEAAALAGRVVAFRTVETDLPRAQLPYRPPMDFWREAGRLFGQATIILVLIGALVLALQNMRLKRGDRSGATRASLTLGLLTLAVHLCYADSLRKASAGGGGINEDVPLGNLGWMLVFAAATAMATWVTYIAVEPYIRRIWPESIISWTRLVQGHFRDPLVGAGILAGAAVGAVGLVLVYINRLMPGWLDLPPARPWVDERLGVMIFEGSRQGIGHMLQCALIGMQTSMLLLVAIVLVKFLVRNTLAAVVVVGLVQSLIWTLSSPVLATWSWLVFAISLLLVSTMLGLAMLVMVRYGVLSMMAAGAVFTALGSLPITTDTRMWYSTVGFIGLLVVCLLPLFGAFTSVYGITRAGEDTWTRVKTRG